MAVLQAVYAELAIKPGKVIAKFAGKILINKYIKGEAEFKPPFPESDEIVWLFYVM